MICLRHMELDLEVINMHAGAVVIDARWCIHHLQIIHRPHTTALHLFLGHMPLRLIEHWQRIQPEMAQLITHFLQTRVSIIPPYGR